MRVSDARRSASRTRKTKNLEDNGILPGKIRLESPFHDGAFVIAGSRRSSVRVCVHVKRDFPKYIRSLPSRFLNMRIRDKRWMNRPRNKITHLAYDNMSIGAHNYNSRCCYDERSCNQCVRMLVFTIYLITHIFGDSRPNLPWGIFGVRRIVCERSKRVV